MNMQGRGRAGAITVLGNATHAPQKGRPGGGGILGTGEKKTRQDACGLQSQRKKILRKLNGK